MPFVKFRKFLIFCSLIAIAYGVGYQAGNKNFNPTASIGLGNLNYPLFLKSNSYQQNSPADLTLFWEVWRRLKENYINKESLDPQKMVYGAISGMVSSLEDPYTVFLNPDQNKESKEELGGSFEGIGAQLGLKDKKIVVIAPLSGTPAEEAGLKPGDWIWEIDGKTTENLSLPEAVSKIRGPRGSKVALSIVRENEEKPLKFVLIRDTILVKSVEWWILSEKLNLNNENFGKIAYLRLSRFGDETSSEWNKVVGEIKSKIDTGQIKGVILDLRNNPGGYLTGSIYIASEFLPLGKTVIIQEGADGIKKTYSVNRQGSLLEIPLVVVINQGSASASEIVAGALRDHQRTKLIGEKTFGKGSIQEAQDLPGGAGLHITTAKWLLPKGEWINGTGIEPDIKVELSEKEPERDLQLERAGEELTANF